MAKLVAFYSYSSSTRRVAELIARAAGGTLLEIEPEVPYPASYDECAERAKKEAEEGIRPALKTQLPDIASYTTVFVGSPNWWGTMPMPIATLLEQHDFSGKTIVPFVSHGGGGLGRSIADIKKLAPNATVLDGLSIYGAGGSSLSKDMDAWLAKAGLAQ